MITPEREALIRLITELSALEPELRFGQMVANLATMAIAPTTEAIWDAEDDQLAAAAQRLINFYRQRTAAVA